jgi:hypothetical protein
MLAGRSKVGPMSNYPTWTVPVNAGHKIANVREMKRAEDGSFYFEEYAIVLEKNGFGPNDWDRFILECTEEFGPHPYHDRCEWILANMSPDYDDYVEWEIESYNRGLEEESLGRPLFPNEY